MARITLRAYLAEAESWIFAGEPELAIRHLRYILTLFPKAVQAYRLLGQALLANKHAAEAADFFLRLLSSDPDDFIAHTGLSAIRQSEGNLSQAIWHMERLVEIKPSVQPIQTELRQLLMQRDGQAPERIAFSRPAMARLYLQGGVFEQAESELRAAINENPDRSDLPVLLASVLSAAGNWEAALAAAQQALGRLPFSLEANRIACLALNRQGKILETAPYRQRLADLDPYYAFADDLLRLETVSDGAVSMEQLV